jgi:tripartite-type tricarboxylate transporter receptor subunit TctC
MLWTVQTVVLILGLTASGTAWAAWPDDNPVEVVVGFAAGGGTDVMARKLLPFVEKRLGGNARFVVVNKPGAGGEIAVAAIARRPRCLRDRVVNVPGYNFLPMKDPVHHGTKSVWLRAWSTIPA